MPSVKEHVFARGPNTIWPEDLHPVIEALRKDQRTIAAKLDADAGVTDTDYAAQLTVTE